MDKDHIKVSGVVFFEELLKAGPEEGGVDRFDMFGSWLSAKEGELLLLRKLRRPCLIYMLIAWWIHMDSTQNFITHTRTLWC